MKSQERISPDDIFRDGIIGSWAECELPYSVVTFAANGKYSSKMWKTPQKKEIILAVWGKWWIKNGRLYNMIHKINPPLIPRMNKPVVDIIVSVSSTKMILIDETGRRYEKWRL